MVRIGTKEEAEQSLSDKIAELTINVEDRECNNEPADDPVLADGETSRTPTAKKHRIPELLSCPPAPRKRLKGSFFADEDEPEKAVDNKEIKTLLSPDQDSSNTSSRQ